MINAPQRRSDGSCRSRTFPKIAVQMGTVLKTRAAYPASTHCSAHIVKPFPVTQMMTPEMAFTHKSCLDKRRDFFLKKAHPKRMRLAAPSLEAPTENGGKPEFPITAARMATNVLPQMT